MKEVFPYLEEVQPEKGDGWLVVPADKLTLVCTHLKEKSGFDCLSCITGTDKGDHVELAYHLFSYETKNSVVLKAKAVAEVDTISHLYPSADWMERETFDMLGINFKGHEDLRRILLPDDWAGYPLRKDYKEGEEYGGMTTRRSYISYIS